MTHRTSRISPANKTSIDANAYAETSKRFSDLSEYDTKDHLMSALLAVAPRSPQEIKRR